MKQRIRIGLLAGLSFSATGIQAEVGDSGSAGGALVVTIAVDGLRGDLLERYDPVFTKGLRRLRDQGVRVEDTVVDHGITVSHAGHVTIATGRHPAHHGITDAGFYVGLPDAPRLTDSVRDDLSPIVGSNADLPGASPKQVLVDGLGEWILNADSAAKAIAVGSGAYSSLLHVFDPRSQAYWYERTDGHYVTSSYYRERLPDWVERYNRERMPELIGRTRRWETSVPDQYRALAREDDAHYEDYRDDDSFPHTVESWLGPERAAEPDAPRRWVTLTPFLDDATFGLAREAVTNEKLGRRGTTDYLAIVASQQDSIAHTWGPLSLEVLDGLVHLDLQIGEFLEFLDTTVGPGNYVLALSSDHGFPNLPEYEQLMERPGRRLLEGEIDVLQNAVAAIASTADARDRALEMAGEAIRNQPFVLQVFTPAELAGSAGENSILALYQRSWRADRVPRLPLFRFSTGESDIASLGLMVVLHRGVVIDLDRAVHGSAWDYDRRVPLLLFGRGVPRGETLPKGRTVDIAPTLAALADLSVPKDLDGIDLLSSQSR